jgi:hypothetical protein
MEYECCNHSFVIVRAYDAFGPENIRYIINDTTWETLFVLISKFRFSIVTVIWQSAQIDGCEMVLHFIPSQFGIPRKVRDPVKLSWPMNPGETDTLRYPFRS